MGANPAQRKRKFALSWASGLTPRTGRSAGLYFKRKRIVVAAAVRPELQGRALGSALLTDVLARATPGVPCVLTTHLRQNVAFYQRFGFEVCAEDCLQPAEVAPYTVWSMVRAAP